MQTSTSPAMDQALVRAFTAAQTHGAPIVDAPTRPATRAALLRRHLAEYDADTLVLNRFGMALARDRWNRAAAHTATLARNAGIAADHHARAHLPTGPATVLISHATLTPDPAVVVVAPDGDEHTLPLDQVHPLPYVRMTRKGHTITMGLTPLQGPGAGIRLRTTCALDAPTPTSWAQDHPTLATALYILDSTRTGLASAGWQEEPVIVHRLHRDQATMSIMLGATATHLTLAMAVTGVTPRRDRPTHTIDTHQDPRILHRHLRHLITRCLVQGWNLTEEDTDR